MKAKIFDFAQELGNRSRQVADMANERTRGVVTQTATLLTDAKGPIKTTAKFANGLNDINHRYIRKVVDLNAKILQGGLDDGVKRLKVAAGSKGIRSLYKSQMDLVPVSRGRISAEFRTGVELVQETFGEMKDLAVATFDDLRGKKPVKKTKVKVRPATKKPVAKKKAAPIVEKKTAPVVAKKAAPVSKGDGRTAKNSSAAA